MQFRTVSINQVEGIISLNGNWYCLCVFMEHRERQKARLAEIWKWVSRIKAFIRFPMKCPDKIRQQRLHTAYTEQVINNEILIRCLWQGQASLIYELRQTTGFCIKYRLFSCRQSLGPWTFQAYSGKPYI